MVCSRGRTMMAGCLDGIRVLELARYQAGPRGGMILSDLGAEVIKLEKIGGEETRKSPPIVNGQSVYFSVYNRGKKSVCLDMRQEAGKEVFWDLLKTADFVLQNFRPGTMAKMGMDYESLCTVKPDIILLSASAFGQYGPVPRAPGLRPDRPGDERADDADRPAGRAAARDRLLDRRSVHRAPPARSARWRRCATVTRPARARRSTSA